MLTNYTTDEILINLVGTVWAKTDPKKLLYSHMRESAITTKILLKESIFSGLSKQLSAWSGLDIEDAIRLCMYLSGLHDVGKCHPLFQDKDISFSEYMHDWHLQYYVNFTGYRHELGSASACKRIWKNNSTFDKRTRRAFSYILAIHHQGKNGKDYPLDLVKEWPAGAAWMRCQDLLEQKLREWIDPPQISIKNLFHVDALCSAITGLVILSDWIASSEALSDTEPNADESAIYGRLDSFLSKCGLKKKTKVENITDFSEMWPWADETTMRPVQRSVNDVFRSDHEMPLLTIIEAPMGEGKTEAGLYAAYRMGEYWGKNGLYFALPTSATANQMIGRVNELLKRNGVPCARLMHGSAWLEPSYSFSFVDSDDYDAASQWLSSSKKAMLSQFGVGTVDQVMMAVLRVKYGILRLLGLTDKVLIIDEVHAYDAYMSNIIIRLLEWCKELEVPVVLLSATLPEAKKTQFLSVYDNNAAAVKYYPMLTSAFKDNHIHQLNVGQSYKHGVVSIRLSNIADDYEKIAEDAENAVRNGGCACIIVNTVKKAQNVYRVLLDHRSSDIEIMLFHARFSMKRRMEIEKECLNRFGPNSAARPKSSILVATQVVEQSLDVDFDYMITEIAPVDLILQRIGRLHRHDDTPRPASLCQPVCNIVIPDGSDYGATEAVYFRMLLDRTEHELRNKTQIDIPDDIPKLVESVYSDEISDEDIEAFFSKNIAEEMQSGKAEECELRRPQKTTFGLSENKGMFYDDEEGAFVSAKTRLGEENVRISIVPDKLYQQIRDMDKPFSLSAAKEVMLLSVSVIKKNVVQFADKTACNGMPVIFGKRRLYGVWIMCADKNNEKNLSVSFDNGKITMDNELGLLIK